METTITNILVEVFII